MSDVLFIEAMKKVQFLVEKKKEKLSTIEYFTNENKHTYATLIANMNIEIKNLEKEILHLVEQNIEYYKESDATINSNNIIKSNNQQSLCSVLEMLKKKKNIVIIFDIDNNHWIKYDILSQIYNLVSDHHIYLIINSNIPYNIKNEFDSICEFFTDIDIIETNEKINFVNNLLQNHLDIYNAVYYLTGKNIKYLSSLHPSVKKIEINFN